MQMNRNGNSNIVTYKYPPVFYSGIGPSEFMINFIDATHNIFQIQQKQIEELQDIITKQQSL